MSDTSFGSSPAHWGLAADVCDHPPRLVDGAFAVPGGHGLGIDLDEDRVRSFV